MSDQDIDRLIVRLSTGLQPVRRLPAPWLRAAVWLGLCSVMFAFILAVHGSHTIVDKLERGQDEVLTLIGAVITSATAVVAAFTLAIPGRSWRWALLPLPSFLLWTVSTGIGCLTAEPIPPNVVVSSPQTCFKMILMFSTPLSLALLLMLRRTFSMQPNLVAIMAGLAAAAGAAVALDLVHSVGANGADLLVHAVAILVLIGVSRLFSVRSLPLAPMLLPFFLAGPVFARSPAASAPVTRPVVVELFTAQGCSSCPPADALLNEFAQTRKDLLPLSFHVDYWNRLGWPDPFSSPEATERQRTYVSRAPDPTLFTPQMVIDGTRAVIGSDYKAVDDAIDDAGDEAVTAAPLSLKTAAGEVTVTVGAGTGRAEIVLIGYDRSHTTPVGRGENSGRTLTELNVVRSVQTIGDWRGTPLTVHQKIPPGQLLAVLLAAPDGRIVGAVAPGR